jgi:Sensors of blue-light using FAD
MYQMAYCSVLTQPLSKAQLQDMIDQAQRNNLIHNITGILMVEQELVIQWLEGGETAVRELWAKLHLDPRHHCLVELLHRNFVTERLFPDWSMHRSSREEMLSLVHSARESAHGDQSSPWAAAIATLCILIDPEYAKHYAPAMQRALAPTDKD